MPTPVRLLLGWGNKHLSSFEIQIRLQTCINLVSIFHINLESANKNILINLLPNPSKAQSRKSDQLNIDFCVFWLTLNFAWSGMIFLRSQPPTQPPITWIFNHLQLWRKEGKKKSFKEKANSWVWPCSAQLVFTYQLINFDNMTKHFKRIMKGLFWVLQ